MDLPDPKAAYISDSVHRKSHGRKLPYAIMNKHDHFHSGYWFLFITVESLISVLSGRKG